MDWFTLHDEARFAVGHDQRSNETFISTVGDIALLNRKCGSVEIEPAQFAWANEPAKLKAFQTPNPSVSIVKVNTPRLLTSPSEPSGATVRPHDRRSHLRYLGNKIIQVRATKVHGGAPFPTAKIVKLDNPL